MIIIIQKIYHKKTKEKNDYNESNYDNQSDKENIGNIPQTSRYDNNTKEKYLSKFFNNIINSKYNNIFDINIKDNNNNIQKDLMKTINTHSKRYNSTYINPIWKDKLNKIDNDNSNYCNNSDIIANESMNNLEVDLNYKFEIRLLKKKINILKKENKEIKEKLNKIKNINENMENNLTGNGNNLLNDIILLNKQYMSYNREYEFNNKNINDKLYFENIILNIMDLKYIYDNDLLINEFIDGVNKLLNISLLSQNNEKSNLNNLVEKINQLIDLKNNLYNNINKYEYLLKENNKYYIYFTSLLNNLNLKNIFELDKFIKNAYIKNIKENDHMKKITDTLFNESLSTNQKTERKNHHSSNQLMNSYSKSINNIINNKNYKLQNFLNNKKSDSRINPNKIDYFLINRRRKYSNNFTKKTLNRTERIENISNSYITNQDDKNTVYQHNKNNSLAYSIKPYTTTNKRRKKRKININLFEQRNNDFYRINNKFNKTDNINQNGLLNNDNDMNDIKYYNNINEKNTINKQVNNNNFDKNFYGHVKNHSVIIFNK
jgi:hypothetical protein